MSEEKKDKKGGCPLCNVSEETMERLRSASKKENKKDKVSIKKIT